MKYLLAVIACFGVLFVGNLIAVLFIGEGGGPILALILLPICIITWKSITKPRPKKQ